MVRWRRSTIAAARQKPTITVEAKAMGCGSRLPQAKELGYPHEL